MFDLPTYRLIHFVGLLLLFASLGGIAFAKRNEQGKPPAMTTILHGVGLVVMLVAGFGMLARLEASATASWVILKLVIWLVLGAMPILARRKIVPPVPALFLSILLAACAAYIAMHKPALW